MGRSFHRVDAVRELATEVAAHARQRDVYVGVIARHRAGGGRRDLVPDASVVWVDCDDAGAVAALRRFEPPPQIVVATGSASNCHAYWLLSHPIPLDELEQINRGLAFALGADGRASDAARILRPPGTANWKTGSPSPVTLLALEPGERLDLREVRQSLPAFGGERSRARDGARPRAEVENDPLLQVPPREYVERLSGSTVARDRKVRCPFHDDKTPSLHVFDAPERGWFCFGCGRGGSIYDFAALLWGRGLRGAEFVRLRRDLQATLLNDEAVEVENEARRSSPPRRRRTIVD